MPLILGKSRLHVGHHAVHYNFNNIKINIKLSLNREDTLGHLL